MKITLSKELLDANNLGGIQNVPPEYQQYFYLPASQEHYRLLIHLAYCFDNSTICDLGTNHGASALALSQNPKNRVFSVDIQNIRHDIKCPNVEFHLGSFETDEKIQDEILKSPFVFLDIDHEYTHEMWLYKFLLEKNWKGIMLCDDIHYFEPMRRFWSEVTTNKVDLTHYGHSSGTGCILFGDNVTFDLR